MTRENIEQAAKEEADKLSCLVYYGGSAISQEDVENAFITGAEWRINSIWHDISEIPKDGKIILVRKKDGDMILYGPDMRYYKESVIMEGDCVNWCYIEDLLPIKEDKK